jgi:hypothetical protein
MSREGRRRWGLFQTFMIGRQNNPMMKRLRLIQTPWFGVYVHFIYREDLDPVPHDHPWNFWRMVLRGGYIENYTADPTNELGRPQMILPWRPLRFPVDHAHRIVMVKPGTVSLVLVGRKRRVWGFWEPLPDASTYGDRLAAALGASITIRPAARWVDYRDALGLRPTEGVSA